MELFILESPEWNLGRQHIDDTKQSPHFNVRDAVAVKFYSADRYIYIYALCVHVGLYKQGFRSGS